MIRFMSDTRYAGLEKEMQHIPGFCPRRSGMVISHLSGGNINPLSLSGYKVYRVKICR